VLEELAYQINKGKVIGLLENSTEFSIERDTEESVDLSIDLIQNQIVASCHPEMSVTNVLSKFFLNETRNLPTPMNI
jgi:hypothetical protein